MHVFWDKGYTATSISDITNATGLKRGSLYNTFNGKEDLFLQALKKYDSGHRAVALKHVENIEDPCLAISTFFDMIVKSTCSDPDRKGCLIVNTSLELSIHNTAVRKFVNEGIKSIATFFERCILRGHKTGQIPENVDARETAKALVACLVGIRVLGRGTYGKAVLTQIANQAKRLIR